MRKSLLIIPLVIGAAAVAALFFGALQERPPFRDSYLHCLTPFASSERETGVCLQKLAAKAVPSYGVAHIEEALRNLTQGNHPRWCHEFMHYAGWALYREKGNLTDAFMAASDECDAGMRHGVVEEYISQEALSTDPQTFAESVIPTACQGSFKAEELRVGAASFCYHGLGHAFMFIANNNLPQALAFCDKLKEEHREGCYTGAFMENIASKQVGRFGAHASSHAYNTSDPDYPCGTLEKRYKDYCYVYKGIWNTNRFQVPAELKEAFADCSLVEQAYREKCWWGVGNNLPGPGKTPSMVGERCSAALQASVQAYEQCIVGAARFLGQLNWDNPQAFAEFCSAVQESHKETCWKAAGRNLRSWSATEQEFLEKCRVFAQVEARELCEHFKA